MSKITSFLAVFLLLFRAKKPAALPQSKAEKIIDEVSDFGAVVKAAAPAAAPKIQKVEKVLDLASRIAGAAKSLRK
jgi:hypothetical protein